MKSKPLFLFSDLSDGGLAVKRQSVAVNINTKKGKNVLGKRFDKCCDVVGQVKMGDCVHYVSMGDWSLHDVVFHLLSFSGPANIYIATWSIAEDAIRLLLKNIECEKILSLSMLLDWRVKVRRPEVLSLIKNNITTIRESSCHAKLAVIDNDEWSISVVGSANLTNNPRIEAGVIHCDKTVADFHKKWMLAEINNSDPFGSKKWGKNVCNYR